MTLDEFQEAMTLYTELSKVIRDKERVNTTYNNSSDKDRTREEDYDMVWYRGVLVYPPDKNESELDHFYEDIIDSINIYFDAKIRKIEDKLVTLGLTI